MPRFWKRVRMLHVLVSILLALDCTNPQDSYWQDPQASTSISLFKPSFQFISIPCLLSALFSLKSNQNLEEKKINFNQD